MIIIKLNSSMGRTVILQLYKSKLEELVRRKRRTSIVEYIIKVFGEHAVDRALDSIYMSDGIIYTPEGDLNSKILRLLEYGNGYYGGFAPLSQAADDIRNRLGIGGGPDVI